MAYNYHVIPGSDGHWDSYRFTTLDANVVKELHQLYRVGLSGINDKAVRSRLRHFMVARPIYGELFAATGALELAQQYAREFSLDRYREFVGNINHLGTVSSRDWARAYREGIPFIEFEGRRDIDVYDSGGVDFQLPELLGDASILTRAWELRSKRLSWRAGIAQFEEFVSRQIAYAPGVAVGMGMILLAGSGDQEAECRGVLKYNPLATMEQAARAAMNAAWDIRFVSSMWSIPIAQARVHGEVLRPACGLTTELSIVSLAGIVRRTMRPPQLLNQNDLRISINLDAFPVERVEAVQEVMHAIDQAQFSRRTEESMSRDTSYTLHASAAYLDGVAPTSWSAVTQRLEGSAEAWWNSSIDGHPANTRAREFGWIED